MYISFDSHFCTTIYSVSSDQQAILRRDPARISRATREQRRQRSSVSTFPRSGFANWHNPAHALISVTRYITSANLEHSISFTIVPAALFRFSTSSFVGEVSRMGDSSAGQPEVVCPAETPPESSSRDPPSPTVSISRQNLEIAKQELG